MVLIKSRGGKKHHSTGTKQYPYFLDIKFSSQKNLHHAKVVKMGPGKPEDIFMHIMSTRQEE